MTLDLKEGRRLLERNPLAFQQWLWHHKEALLATAEQIEAAVKVVEAARGMRSWYDKDVNPDGPADTFDSALADFERLRSKL